MFHVVSPGESLGFIASQYGVPIEDLKAANNSHKDILRPHPGKEIVIPQSRMLHTREKPRAVQTIGNPSASLSLTGFQSAVAANAPGIQLVAGLIAAAAFGRVLLQWAPSPAPVPAQGPGGYYQPPTTTAFSGVDALLQEAQAEIQQVEGQLHGLQVARLRQPQGPQRTATLLPPETPRIKSEDRKPGMLQNVFASTTTLAPPANSSSSSSTASSTATLTPSSSSSSSSSSSASSPATEVVGPESEGGPANAAGKQQGQGNQLFGFGWPTSQPQQAAQPQTWPLPFQEPEQPLQAQWQQQPASTVLPFSGPAELVVQSNRTPQPAPPTPTFPLNDPFAGKSLISLKSNLMDEVIGTARGVTATGRQRGAIEELILALEARNPQPKPTSCMGMMEGHWKLVYTTNTQTLMMLNAIDALPLVDIGNVYQIIDAESMTASNKIDIALPISQSWPLSLTSEAMFEVRTPRAFKVRFTKVGLDTYVQTPQILSALEIPDTISVLGTSVDLTPLRELIVNPLNAGLETAQSVLQTALNPEFEVQVSELASSWMLTTYLDETVRISRDESGRLFVMMKDFEKDDPLFASEDDSSTSLE